MRQNLEYKTVENLKNKLDRLFNTLTVTVNQRRILKAAKSYDRVFLNPVAPRGCGGSVEHYYHFVFDLVLPLHSLVERVSPKTVFVLKDIGPFSSVLQVLFPGRIEFETISSGSCNLMPSLDLVGMNPLGVEVKLDVIEKVKNRVFEAHGLTQHSVCDHVLLIERVLPSSYYLDKAVIKGGGAKRRSIVNHDELKSVVTKAIGPSCDFRNVQLEKIPFVDQVELFSKAKLVIAQHGAGLANSIWMSAGSIVVELNSDPLKLKHFSMISRLKGHSHYTYKLKRKHAVVDVKDFLNWLLEIDEISTLFHPLDGLSRCETTGEVLLAFEGGR